MNDEYFDMPIEEFRREGYKIIDWIADYFETIEDKPVLARVQPGETKELFPPIPPQNGDNFDKIFEDLNSKIMPAMTHWNHPGFMSYFNSTASGPAILGDFLSSALNINGMIWKTSPASTELEEVVLNWLRQMLQIPERFFGIIYDLASVSSLHAIAAAREQAKALYEEFDINKPILPRISAKLYNFRSLKIIYLSIFITLIPISSVIFNSRPSIT